MINYILYAILLIETLVQHVTLFVFVNNFLEVKNKKIYYIASIPFALFGFILDLIREINASFTGGSVIFTYKSVVLILSDIILLLILTKGSLIKKLFTLILAHGLIFALDGISVQLFFDSERLMDTQNTPINYKVVGYLYFTIMFVVITFLTNKLVKKKGGTYNTKQLCVLTLFFVAQFGLLILTTHNINAVTNPFSISIFVISVLIIVTDIIIANLIEEASEKGRLEEQLRCIDEIQKGEKDYYNNLVEKEKMMSTIRHDWNEQLQTALTLCTDENSEKAAKAKQIISELNENLLKSVPKKFTQNITLNALLNSKTKLLEDADIKYSFDVQLKEDINIDLINLCSIFSNLINNAYEYSVKNADNNNFIELKAKHIDNKIIIKCTNDLKKDDKIIGKNEFKTTKADSKNHGYGLAIIKSLAQKYNGNLNIDIVDCKFVANLYVLENN